MGGKGSVLAFDRDPKRLDRLKANAAATGATNIVAQQVCTSQVHIKTYITIGSFSKGSLCSAMTRSVTPLHSTCIQGVTLTLHC